jgi:hypothetical protein
LSNTSSILNIGGMVSTICSIFPAAASAGTVNGVSIDRSLHGLPMSATMHTAVGAQTGSPSAMSVVPTLQHSPDGSTWSAYLPDNVNAAAAPALTAAASENEIAINLSAAQRYIRVQAVVGFTGGSSPSAQLCALVTIGGENRLPSV